MAKKKRSKKKTGPVQKQKATVYTMMLICSFFALVLACILLYMELERYGHDIKAEEYEASLKRPALVAVWRDTA